ncbi:molybdopterin converting factor subunit 1 [Bacillus horti]|uniref:Molybdopterin synthase sulfur carrier subunit n=1 Tax=Caldalkalibacillus horti TaxID=77523 RepID=A0ABT9W4J0_9BACI|nr:molybdopterin converting factor subunit 1 [Bacillus horti]MDQ0167775.1 molybdopterin synthase sulfur carrier subunit [Bacillus horti]
MIRVLLFAGIQEKLQTHQLTVPFEELTVQELKSYLIEQHHGLKLDLNQALFAVNQEFADEEQLIKAQDEVAIIPPVSGG